MLLLLFTFACTSGDQGPIATIEIDVSEGAIPFIAQLEVGGGAESAAIIWTLEDGSTSDAEALERTFLASGIFEIELTVTDDEGRSDSASVEITVDPGICPESGSAIEQGTVTSGALIEISGVAESRVNPGVLWVHNDAGDSPRLFALDTTGALLGTYDLTGASPGDWEDLAIGVDPETGGAILFAGDVGDNNGVRSTIRVYLVPEPEVVVGQAEVNVAVAWDIIELVYPDGPLNSETLLWDPATGDLYIVTKDYDGPTGIFRKPAPHIDGETTTLELVAELDFSVDPLTGSATTGGDVSMLGDRIVIRTYNRKAFVWLRDRAVAFGDTFAAAPCEIKLPSEQQGESVGFSVDDRGVWTISEGTEPSVYFLPFEDPEADTGADTGS